jgi:outer membrane protein TolC
VAPASPPDGPLLTLAAAIDQAQVGNLDLKVANERKTQAHESVRKVYAAYLPQLSLGANYTLNSSESVISLPTGYDIRDVGTPQGKPFDPSKPVGLGNSPGAQTNLVLFPSAVTTATIQPYNQVSGQIQLSQILVAPVLWPAIQNAHLTEEYATVSIEVARREILFGVAQLYFACAGLQQAIAVDQKILALNREHEHDAQVKFNAGYAPKLLLVRAQIDTARAEQDLKRAQIAYKNVKVQLSVLLNREPDFEVETPPDPAAVATGAEAFDRASKDRVDIQAADMQATMAHKFLDVVWQRYLPTLSLSAYFRESNYSGFSTHAWSAAASLNLNWVLYDGGLREATIRSDQSQIVEADIEAQQVRAKVRGEVQKALLDLESALANREKSVEQRRLAQENMELVRVNSVAGKATSVEFADASSALESAELGFVAESLNVSVARLALARAQGAFNPAVPGSK